MPHAPRRLALPCLALAALLAVPSAVPASPPEEIQQAIAASKLRYEVGPGPVQKPVEELHCPARSTDTRVVREADGGKRLAPWKPSPGPQFAEAEKLFAQKDFPAALTRYRKVLELDPTLAQAHRFAGDVLLKLGRSDEAKDEYVKALVYGPSGDGALEGLEALGSGAGFSVARHELLPPAGALGEAADGKVPIALAPERKAWLPYLLCKAVWRNEPTYRARRLGQAGLGDYNWTVEEEVDCLSSYLVGNLNTAEAEVRDAIRKANPKAEIAEVPIEQVLAGTPPLVRHLKEVTDAGLLPGYVLYAALGRRCPLAIALLPDNAQEDLERYIRRFVIVPTSVGSAAPKPAKP